MSSEAPGPSRRTSTSASTRHCASASTSAKRQRQRQQQQRRSHRGARRWRAQLVRAARSSKSEGATRGPHGFFDLGAPRPRPRPRRRFDPWAARNPGTALSLLDSNVHHLRRGADGAERRGRRQSSRRQAAAAAAKIAARPRRLRDREAGAARAAATRGGCARSTRSCAKLRRCSLVSEAAGESWTSSSKPSSTRSTRCSRRWSR